MKKELQRLILAELEKAGCSTRETGGSWPVAWCKDVNNIKAIVLGCDPSNIHDQQLKYPFALETENKKLKLFFSGIKANLKIIGLSEETVYIQNLCQNYFMEETSKNKYWKKAAEVWIPYLKEELNSLPINKNVPVFLTAGMLYEVLLSKGVKKYKPKELYSNSGLLPIRAEDNLLERPLFPLYRGGFGTYNLRKWEEYGKYVKRYFDNN